MKRKNIVVIIILMCIITGFQFYSDNNSLKDYSYAPENGFVPDEETAIKIAETILLPILGKGYEQEKPFVANLKDSTVWVVSGTIKREPGKTYKGGVAYIEIRKSDCKILTFRHPK